MKVELEEVAYDKYFDKNSSDGRSELVNQSKPLIINADPKSTKVRFGELPNVTECKTYMVEEGVKKPAGTIMNGGHIQQRVSNDKPG